jgi:D-citramalate synthase
MDTTLRDGEQTSGVSFSVAEKLALSKLLLDELNVDRIEIGSARVSYGELKAVKEVSQWAQSTGNEQRIEILTFVDGGTSIDWMVKSGAKVQNLLTKGSLNHLKHQLKKTPDQHFKAIEEHVLTAQKEGISTNVYLEDWSNGMRNSRDYVNDYLSFISPLPVKRVLLPDTLGVMTYYETFSFISEVVKSFPEIHFDFHGHNDYDLSVPNAIEAVRAGCHGLHLTVNGMGERAGNTPMASTVANLKDFLHDVEININESSLYKVSKLVATFTGFRIPANKPIVGQNVFTQTAGIHADGDKKKNLYFNDLLPERFGRTREYALGKTSGRANIQKNLQKLGINLNDDEIKKVTQRIIELGDKKEIVTTEDLPFIISDILNSNTEQKVSVKSYVLTHAKGLQPNTVVSLDMEGEVLEENAAGDGQFDAFMNALKKIYRKKKMTLAKLTDYAVRIPPGSNSDALCETLITWKNGEKEFITRGLDSDQTVSAIKATEKMLNIISS